MSAWALSPKKEIAESARPAIASHLGSKPVFSATTDVAPNMTPPAMSWEPESQNVSDCTKIAVSAVTSKFS